MNKLPKRSQDSSDEGDNKVPSIGGTSSGPVTAKTTMDVLMSIALGTAIENGGTSVAGVMADTDAYITRWEGEDKVKVTAFLLNALGASGGVKRRWHVANNELMKRLGTVGSSFVAKGVANFKGWCMLGYILMIGMGGMRTSLSKDLKTILVNFENKFQSYDIREFRPADPRDMSERDEIVSETVKAFGLVGTETVNKAAAKYALILITAANSLTATVSASSGGTIGDYVPPTEAAVASDKAARQRRAGNKR